MLIEAEEIARFVPNTPSHMLDDIADALSKNLTKYGINTPLRIVHYLAQVAHESGGFTIKRESGRYSEAGIMRIFGVGKHSAKITQSEAKKLAAQCKKDGGKALFNRVYGAGNPNKAKELGNIGADDGWNFRGTGWIQTTGRGAFQRMSQKVGFDFTVDPAAMGELPWAAVCSMQEFVDMRCLDAADKDDIRLVTRRVNGGYNGLADRIALLARARKVWPDSLLKARLAGKEVAAKEVDDGLNEESIRKIQSSLKALGYPEVGRVDGEMGQRTRGAIVSFKTAQGLKIDPADPSAIDAEFWEALANAPAREISLERATASAADLKAEGSTTIATAENIKKAALVAGGLGAAGGTEKAGLLDTARDTVEHVSEWQSVLISMKGILSWVGGFVVQYWPIAAVAGCFAAWHFGNKIISERVRKHQDGEDVSL